jgi:hypothetical protein
MENGQFAEIRDTGMPDNKPHIHNKIHKKSS